MSRNNINKEVIENKLEYLGLNLEKPNKMDFKIVSSYEDNKYKQYRYININDIKIILSPTNRLDDLSKKLKYAKDIETYLDYKNERNIEEHAKFLEMLSNVSEESIEEIEEEQKALNKNIPFNVKFTGNYLWQIYYFENIDEYVMIVPTEETDNSTFFYILKEKIRNRPNAQVYVPIRNVDYSNKFIKKTTFEEMENFMWVFTKDWASIYEVYDKTGKMEINILGETYVYPQIKSIYKIILTSKEETIKFYKLMKALYILQTELPNHYKFTTKINSEGGIDIYLKERKLEYKIIGRWISHEYVTVKKRTKEAKKLIKTMNEKLDELKEISAMQEIEYINKEKQISTYLECRKTIIGKFKYFFKYSKKESKINIKNNKSKKPEIEINSMKTNSSLNTTLNQDTGPIAIDVKKESHSLDELLEVYEKYIVLETELKNIMLDINSIKLKNKNTKKKIENATNFINEIDKHKRSIFEFWKYSNKDEVSVLPEGEIEETLITKNIRKIFDYNEDFEKFGMEMDRIQRKVLTKRELDNLFVATTTELEVVNDIRLNRIAPKDLDVKLKTIKKDYMNSLKSEGEDIFGSKINSKDTISKIGNKRHREIPKNIYSILDIGKNATKTGYKLALEQVIDDITKSLNKIKLQEDVCGYIACLGKEFDKKEFNVLNLNLEEEAVDIFKAETDNNKLYKITLKKGIGAIAFTNSIFFDNQNKTLPIGQDISNKIIADLSKEKLELVKEEKVRIVSVQQDTTLIKTINVLEYEII